ncbi:zinc finger, CCHC-type containing protein [Tanacetum coccineum]|uniref:Zinc finger, CCHC-type containing protein n=1 Tax=Tanacetum coccineum TaxID=301880 RepID=A0ABQ5DXR7_9ASTR
MADAAMKHMASNYAKLDKFEGVDFKRWQKKMHFLLSSTSVVYVLTTLIPEDELWDALEAKYMVEDASSKKFHDSNFTNYKMTDSRPVLEQYNELLEILGRFTQHKMNMDEAIQVSCIIDKLPLSWKDFKHTLKHKKEELTVVELGSHLHSEESLRVQDSDKPKGNNVAGPSVVNMVEHKNSSRNVAKLVTLKGIAKVLMLATKPMVQAQRVLWMDDDVAWWVDSGATVYECKDRCTSQGFWGEAMLTACYLLNMVPNKRNKIAPYELWTRKKPNLNYLRVWGYRTVVRLLDPKLKNLGERGIECIFVGYTDHSNAFRFSSVPKLSQRSLVNGTEDFGGSVVSEEVTEKVVQQPEPELRKSKRNRTPKTFGPEFQLYLIEGTRDEVSDQHSYCFNVEDDPKTFDEAMKSQDVAFWKEAINDEMDSIMGNNT